MGEEIIRHKVTFSGGEPTSAKNFARIALSVFFLFSFFWGGVLDRIGFLVFILFVLSFAFDGMNWRNERQ